MKLLISACATSQAFRTWSRNHTPAPAAAKSPPADCLTDPSVYTVTCSGIGPTTGGTNGGSWWGVGPRRSRPTKASV
eukprot:10528051-Alexandrium_andersonii.AAC.1